MSQAQPVIVYTMGKVASTSISTALINSGVDCLDVHFLVPENINNLASRYEGPEAIGPMPPHLVRSRKAIGILDGGKPVKVISLVREPVMRMVSNIFQKWPLGKRAQCKVETVRAELVRHRPFLMDRWFKTEFIPVTGIDIFNEQFDKTADHFVMANAKFNVLIMKTDADNVRKQGIISNFLGVDVEISRDNDSSKKWYSQIIREFKDNPELIGADYVRECLNTEYFNTFFSDEEKQETAKKYGV